MRCAASRAAEASSNVSPPYMFLSFHVPVGSDLLAHALRVGRRQLKVWLQKAIPQQRVERQERPVRYNLRRSHV